MPKREPALDLLRCTAFIFVVTFHSFLNNGYYFAPQVGISMWLAGSFRWLSVSCIGLYLMLTGYLKSHRTDAKACYRGLPPVLLGYLLAAMISIPIRHFVFEDVQSLRIWCERLFNFSAVSYGWYVEMYIGLVLLMPFVNMVLERLRDTKKLLAFGMVMLALTALPGATPWPIFPDYWRGVYPLTFYVLGAILRRLQPKVNPWLGIAGAVSVSAILGAATILSTDGKLSEALIWEFPDLWIVLIAVCLFTAVYRVRIPRAFHSVLAFCAGGCYGGYLLSYLFDAWCYNLVPGWKTPSKYGWIFLCVTVPVAIASLLLGVLLERVAKGLWVHKKRDPQNESM